VGAMAKSIILGGGMTGLAAGAISDLPVYEGALRPGGICSSYYMRPGVSEVLPKAPDGAEAYRFEIGGGHWIFGGDPAVIHFLGSCAKLETYQRKSGVYLSDEELYIPYPLENHLRCLGEQRAAQALLEMSGSPGPITTMKDWIEGHFGKLLCE